MIARSRMHTRVALTDRLLGVGDEIAREVWMDTAQTGEHQERTIVMNAPISPALLDDSSKPGRTDGPRLASGQVLDRYERRS